MFSNILVAANLARPEDTVRALKTGQALLSDAGRLTLATVIDAGSVNFFPHIPSQSPAETEQAARQELRRLLEQNTPPDLSCHVLITHGREGRSLVKAVNQLGADLLVLTAAVAQPQRVLLSDPVTHLSQFAPCNLLLLRR